MLEDNEQEFGSALLKQYADFFKLQNQQLSTSIDTEWNLNKSYHLIQLTLNTGDLHSTFDLVTSDNVVMSKILCTLSSLCLEINCLKNEASERHYPFISLFGSTDNDIIKHMDSLCQLTAFVERCQTVLKNISAQVFALYATKLITLGNIDFHYVLSHISELTTILLITDFLISNSNLKMQWKQFCKDIKKNGISENFTAKAFKNILKVAETIENKIMSEKILMDSLNELTFLKQTIDSKSYGAVAKEFNNYLKSAISSLDVTASEGLNNELVHKCVKINALFLLNSQIFGNSDKKLFKMLLDLNSKSHSIPLCGNNIWYPEQFLQRYLSTHCSSKVLQPIMKSRQNYLMNKKQVFPKELLEYLVSGVQWISSVENTFSNEDKQLNASDMSSRVMLLLEGLELVSKINYSVKTIVSLHLTLSFPMTKTLLQAFFVALELQKYLENVVERNNLAIILSINMIMQHLMYQAMCLSRNMKKNLMNDKKMVQSKLDELTCLVVAEKALSVPPSDESLTVANLALSLLPVNSLMQDTYTKIALLLEKTKKISHFMKLFRADCDCSWLLWHKEMIPMYMMQNILNKQKSYNLIAGCKIFEDCLNTLRVHEGDNSTAVEKFKAEIKDSFDSNIFNPLNQLLETNLRLQTHSHLHATTSEELMPVNRSLLLTEKYRLFPEYISVTSNIENYLSTMFYNLTTIVLSDWKTYGEMRQLAKYKYNIETVEDNLPTQTLEQGIDVLDIMRNIDRFVTKYLYNLNNQIFIERQSNNKHLNTINITHIANSIRTHGTGIMNTAVNFTYKFLRKAFSKFSEILYDERIKSRLVKEVRKIRDCLASGNKTYPFKFAEKLAKDFRNLDTSEEGFINYLDRFRVVVSEIGNAMGYVRMIRSGGRHFCADSIAYLPSLERSSFKTAAENCGLDELTVKTAETVDENIDNLLTHFIHGTEYFKLLVDTFSAPFRNSENIHLSFFYAIMPALMLNHVEHMILCKDKMMKNHKDGAAFTDDGFAMGLAYVLRLLDQDTAFDSLNWFQSVWNHINDERKSIQEQRNKSGTQIQQALALTEKKYMIFEQEFQLLFYTFSSARIFFQ